MCDVGQLSDTVLRPVLQTGYVLSPNAMWSPLLASDDGIFSSGCISCCLVYSPNGCVAVPISQVVGICQQQSRRHRRGGWRALPFPIRWQ